jgi:tetratricopeptide (TPR) repeat protein
MIPTTTTMSARMRVTMLVGLMGLASAPAIAAAQTARPPVPVPAPVPVPMPAPLVNPVISPAPVLANLAALDQLRLLSLDDARLSLEGAKFALADAKLVQDSARHALEMSKWALEPHFDFHWADSQQTMFRDGDYSAGRDLVIRRQYEQAIQRFDKVIARKANNVDGSLYWKAFAQFKLGKTDESLATIATLRKDHPQSPYLGDAKVLETDARRMAGKPVNPSDVDDEELKMIAINGIKNAEPDRAITALEGVLKTTNSPSHKRQALYVLASMEQPRAYQVLASYAKGAGNPDLQLDAIRYMTTNRSKNPNVGKDLMDIYQTTQSNDVKMAIISVWRSSGNSPALVQVMTSGQAPMPIRQSALSGLSGMLGPQDLWTIYEKETNKELKMQIIGAFGSMQAFDQLNRVVKSEKDPELRRRALRALGMMKSDKTGQILVDLYGAETDVESKRSIISSLSGQNNAEGLVAIARKETSLQLKT